jgi:hypothetical protein
VCYTPIPGRKPSALGQEVNSHPLKPDKEKRVLRGGGYIPLLLAVDSGASGGQGGKVVLIRLVFVTCHCGQLLPAMVIHVMLLNLLTQCDRSGSGAFCHRAARGSHPPTHPFLFRPRKSRARSCVTWACSTGWHCDYFIISVSFR